MKDEIEFDAKEYAELRAHYFEPVVVRNHELAEGVRLRRQTKPPRIDRDMPGFKLLKARIAILESSQEHAEILRLLRKLRENEIKPATLGGRTPAELRGGDGGESSGVHEVIDTTMERDVIDVDAFILNELFEADTTVDVKVEPGTEAARSPATESEDEDEETSFDWSKIVADASGTAVDASPDATPSEEEDVEIDAAEEKSLVIDDSEMIELELDNTLSIADVLSSGYPGFAEQLDADEANSLYHDSSRFFGPKYIQDEWPHSAGAVRTELVPGTYVSYARRNWDGTQDLGFRSYAMTSTSLVIGADGSFKFGKSDALLRRESADREKAERDGYFVRRETQDTVMHQEYSAEAWEEFVENDGAYTPFADATGNFEPSTGSDTEKVGMVADGEIGARDNDSFTIRILPPGFAFSFGEYFDDTYDEPTIGFDRWGEEPAGTFRRDSGPTSVAVTRSGDLEMRWILNEDWYDVPGIEGTEFAILFHLMKSDE